MTRNAIDALRNQEIERHNRFQEQQDKIWRPVEAVGGAVGSIGSVLRGIGSFKGKTTRYKIY